MAIEHKVYGPESTAAEISDLRARIFLLQEDVVCWHEVPVLSEFQFNVMYEEYARVIESLPKHGLLVDARLGGRPTAKDRARLRTLFEAEDSERLFHAAVVVGVGRTLLVVAARFVMRLVPDRKLSVHATLEQGVRAIDNAR